MDLREVREFIIDTSKYILTMVVVIFIIMYVATVQQIIGPSMESKYKDQDIVILNKLHYRFFKIKRFDVVSLNGSLISAKRMRPKVHSFTEASFKVEKSIFKYTEW